MCGGDSTLARPGIPRTSNVRYGPERPAPRAHSAGLTLG
jgi:hypothetical protein